MWSDTQRNERRTHLQSTWYGYWRLSHVLLRIAFFRFGNNARFDASEDGDDEDVDWKHEKAALYSHHDLLPGDFQRTCKGEKRQSRWCQ